jgi:hypothetical protein
MSVPSLRAAALFLLLLPGATAPAAERTLAEKPVTTARGKLGDRLRAWYADGSAAGNVGDWYDNRDRGHSGLRTKPYPQLRKITYTPAQLKRRADWAAQRRVLPKVVFGNSSTSGPVTRNGSNVRSYYCSPRGLAFLYQQYTHNNLYIYPEHRDHDPDHNGNGGYGDLFPTNTPCLIASQGSSGSDQPFMRAMPFVLAAFRPDVKTRLVQAGLLMPTVQMIFRRSNKHLEKPADYYTGKAHPTVFQGRDVDALRMAEMARSLTSDTIPPMVQLAVVNEDRPVRGRDYFEPGRTEVLGDTPVCIARVVRGRAYVRKMTVSAEKSYDLNERPLTFKWVVLRGDPKKVRIEPKNDAGSVVELAVAYHPRRPIAPGSKLESNRVDIGCFVHNGAHPSAPGFVTFFTIDSEARTCTDEGRLVEIGYGSGTILLSVADWEKLFALLRPEAASPAAGLLRGQLSKPERAALLTLAGRYAEARAGTARAEEMYQRAAATRKAVAEAIKQAKKHVEAARSAQKQAPGDATKAALAKAEAALADAEAKRKKADDAYRAARKTRDAARRAERDLLRHKQPGLDPSPSDVVVRAFRRLANPPRFAPEHRPLLTALYAEAPDKVKKAVDDERRRLTALGILKPGEGGSFEVRPVADELTRYETALLRRLNGVLLGELLYPDVVNSAWRVNLVDARLAGLKAWRDVYRYDEAGTCVGWTRYSGAGVREFTADGHEVLERDAAGRCTKARKIGYRYKRTKRWARATVEEVPGAVVTP